MPQVTVNIKVEDIAKIIGCMEKRELETLSILLTDEGKELLQRKKDIECKEVKTLSRKQIFDD